MGAAPTWRFGLGTLWPINAEDTLGETPAWSSQVAAVWRESWRPIGSMPRARHVVLILVETIEGEQARLRPVPRRAHSSLLRLPLPDPLSQERPAKLVDHRHQPPRASVLVR
jgi:hypothetical protein